ncbi:unnamed protein product [Acanthoscelides obtectus]|uniref:Uncharacterized protein n=1 Tax=Acanthoscelides obtectus TaxID=200917 RepID=A0A9P0LUY2_ACAOB|nr:unnamed protein product [Acanthoscelides obtectus]CAK1665052.1 hypothetical protein AOBTE_LOCUS24632 [Acanthoscelides obtectus]
MRGDPMEINISAYIWLVRQKNQWRLDYLDPGRTVLLTFRDVKVENFQEGDDLALRLVRVGTSEAKTCSFWKGFEIVPPESSFSNYGRLGGI